MAESRVTVVALRLSALGDVILTLPALRLLRRQVESVRIVYISRRTPLELLQYSPLVDQCVEFPSNASISTLRKLILAQNPDYLFDFHASLRTRLARTGLGIPYSSHESYTIQRRLHLLGTSLNIDPVWKRHSSLVQDAIINQPIFNQLLIPSMFESESELICPPDDRKVAEENHEKEMPRVAILPGAGHDTKRWPAEYYAELVSRLEAAQIRTVTLGSPQEGPLVREVAQQAKHSSDGSWKNLLVQLQGCQVAVGNDSGLSHLAEALGIPVIMLFGPTVPAFGFGPRLPASSHLEVPLSCRPCSLHGGDFCPKQHHACLRGLSVDLVFQATLQLLGGKR